MTKKTKTNVAAKRRSGATKKVQPSKTSNDTTKKAKGRSSKNTNEKTIQIHVWNIKLTKESRKQLNRVKDCMWGSVAHAIERGDWYVPVKDYRFTHIKKELEEGMVKFFDIDGTVEIEDFETNIIEYDNH